MAVPTRRANNHLTDSAFASVSRRFEPSFGSDEVNMFDLLSMRYTQRTDVEKKKPSTRRDEQKRRLDVPATKKAPKKTTKTANRDRAKYKDCAKNSVPGPWRWTASVSTRRCSRPGSFCPVLDFAIPSDKNIMLIAKLSLLLTASKTICFSRS